MDNFIKILEDIIPGRIFVIKTLNTHMNGVWWWRNDNSVKYYH